MLKLKDTLSAELTPESANRLRAVESAAYYCQPRMYYCNLSQTDGIMLVQLCMAERAVAFTEQMLDKLMRRKDIYRFALKKHGNALAGLIKQYRRLLDNNLKCPEGDMRINFADVNDFVDEAIAPDLMKMRYAVINHVNRNKLSNAEAVSDICMSMLLCDFYHGLSNYVKETIHGSIYVLCSDGGVEALRQKGLYLTNGLLKPFVKELEDMFEVVGPKNGVEFDKCQGVMDGMRVLINKMLSIDIMAPACKAAGVCDVRDEVAQRVVNMDATPEEAARIASGESYLARARRENKTATPTVETAIPKKEISKATLAESLASKGWKVTNKAI